MSFRRALRPFRRTMSGEKIYEGVFAVHKPEGVSSADVVRHLQHHFNPSELFRPWLADERARRDRESNFQRKRRRTQRLEVKIGHGGTLDPMATGVLVAGVGKGTKHLNEFLACTKEYETVVLFGAETDTYDRMGKLVRKGPYEHITREMVEKALEQFRGKIMQRPPIFSALKVQGKKLYEYAREGKEPPIEIKSRPVEVHDLKVVEWYEPGTHEWKWPTTEVEGEEKVVAEKLLEKEDKLPVVEREGETTEAEEGAAKRPAEDDAKEVADEAEAPAKKQKVADGEAAPVAQAEASDAPTAETETAESQAQPQPAAVKITMTVSSGFYVRSLAHDLGKAVGSCGLMSSLVRSRQAQFELDPEKVLEYKDLEAGEEVWGPKVKQFLEDWEEKRLARSPPS
ncbi:pseudouridine synthase PUS4 [Aspergillus ibericus CBS 121593]|uniref:tRNA pseudouridine(55) synthase n=1 Tax=Aspergillus ibericus CBS 121593 TaxID=1448316 RepID=A0A395HGS5_9EURO|nr:pseudouridine synthase [Aspergillus ibericus CBS 121593]RAL06178.1 pseudouridine synthase [Aspergillus ibericus CBS 121593]